MHALSNCINSREVNLLLLLLFSFNLFRLRAGLTERLTLHSSCAFVNTELIKEILIDTINSKFDLNENDNTLKRVTEGAHSEARVIYNKDKTGASIHQAALQYLQGLDNVEILTNHIAIDLLTFSHHSKESTDIYKKPSCFGPMVLNNSTNEIYPILSSKTILATGGL